MYISSIYDECIIELCVKYRRNGSQICNSKFHLWWSDGLQAISVEMSYCLESVKVEDQTFVPLELLDIV